MNAAAARQTVRYLRASDGVRLAWAEVGRGPTLVKASNWLTHLELEWESPVWRHWLEFFSRHYRFVRYDERGCGMSDWNVETLGTETSIGDLTSVVDAAGAQGAIAPIVLLGISQGAAPAIEFAIRHPERVSHLLLYGGYSEGWMKRSHEGGRRRYVAMLDLIEDGWGRSNPVFRQLFTSRFIPGGTDAQLDWFNDLCLKTTSQKNAARLLQSRAHIDIRRRLPELRVPTLVLHARNDEVVPLSAGKILATEIPGAQFVELDSANHVLLAHEPAWQRFCDAVVAFTGVAASPSPSGSTADAAAFAELTLREREVLALVSDGLGNGEIAEKLGISDKTVRNHVSKLFDKLGVWTRAQAIVFARDRGFEA